MDRIHQRAPPAPRRWMGAQQRGEHLLPLREAVLETCGIHAERLREKGKLRLQRSVHHRCGRVLVGSGTNQAGPLLCTEPRLDVCNGCRIAAAHGTDEALLHAPPSTHLHVKNNIRCVKPGDFPAPLRRSDTEGFRHEARIGSCACASVVFPFPVSKEADCTGMLHVLVISCVLRPSSGVITPLPDNGVSLGTLILVLPRISPAGGSSSLMMMLVCCL